MSTHQFAIVGTQAPDINGNIDDLTTGAPVRIVPMPDNPVDPNAIAVYRRGERGQRVRIGYLPKHVAARFAFPPEGVLGSVATTRTFDDRVVGADIITPRAGIIDREGSLVAA